MILFVLSQWSIKRQWPWSAKVERWEKKTKIFYKLCKIEVTKVKWWNVQNNKQIIQS